MRFVLYLCLTTTVWAADATIPEVAQELTDKIGSDDADGGSALIGSLVARYERATQADQVIAIGAIGKAASANSVELRHDAFRALAKLRVEGSGKYLARWLSPPKKGEVDESCFKAIEAAGEIADPRLLSRMRKLCDHKNTEVAVAAIRALAGYKALPVPERKQLAMDLVRDLEKLSSGGTRGWGRGAAQGTRRETEETGTPMGRPGSSQSAEERAGLLRNAIARTLQTVTGQHYDSVAEWSGWRKRARKQKDPFA